MEWPALVVVQNAAHCGAVVEDDWLGRVARRRRGWGGRLRQAGQVPAPTLRPKRSRRPLCHTTIPKLFFAFREEWWEFRRDYAAASERYRAGAYYTRFPEGALRPPIFDVS